MPKSKHRKNHKHALNKSTHTPGGVLSQIVDSMMPVTPIAPLPSDKRQNRRSLKL